MYQQEQSGLLKTLRMIWGALLFSQLIYGVVLYTSKRFVFEPVEVDPLVGVFAALALLTPLIGEVFSGMLRAKAQSAAELLPGYVIGWALAESCTIFGLVISMIKGSAIPYVALMAYSWFFFFRQRPSAQALAIAEKANH